MKIGGTVILRLVFVLFIVVVEDLFPLPPLTKRPTSASALLPNDESTGFS